MDVINLAYIAWRLYGQILFFDPEFLARAQRWHLAREWQNGRIHVALLQRVGVRVLRHGFDAEARLRTRRCYEGGVGGR